MSSSDIENHHDPLIHPLGFDWRIGISLVTGLAAKEVVVSTLGTIFSIGKTADNTSLSSIPQK